MNNRTRTSVRDSDLAALAAWCEGALEGANPPPPADAILRLAALILADATREAHL